MHSELKLIQSILNKYAQTLNSILEVDIEIVDRQLIRISGTGIYQNALDINIEDEGFLYASTFEGKKDLIVLDILNNPICSKCAKKSFCANKLIVAVPILYDDVVIGVIGIISTNEQRKVYIRNRLRQYLEFVHHISDLISSKVAENQKQILETSKLDVWMEIMNVIEKGVIILEPKGGIAYINNIAQKQLRISKEELEGSVTLLSVDNISDSNDRITMRLGERSFSAIGKLIAVHSFVQSYDKLVIIDRPEAIEHLIDKKNPPVPAIESQMIVGTSQQMKDIQRRIGRIAISSSTVLITGESGTGKELIAKEIHQQSDRKEKPFVAVNCGAIPENLLESEFFGYVKGAFTGANLSGKLGKFELANTGILFLDEIGDMPLHLQVKILRVLQEKRFYRVGSNKVVDLDIKIIAATNKDLKKMCETGQFRTDLYYRLNVIPIQIPPLRERREDILDLFYFFIRKYSEKFHLNGISASQDAIDCIYNYEWIGNVRELENSVEYSLNLIEDYGVISTDILPEHVKQNFEKSNLKQSNNDDFEGLLPKGEIVPLEKLEQNYIRLLLEHFGDNTESKKMIAKKLGIGVATLYRKINAGI